MNEENVPFSDFSPIHDIVTISCIMIISSKRSIKMRFFEKKIITIECKNLQQLL